MADAPDAPVPFGCSAEIRARAFPDLDPARIVLEREDVVVVDKPEGVPCQEVRPGDGDDLPSRLRRVLAARRGMPEADVYVGTHQRLDEGTSGAIVYTASRSANAAVAAAMEGREATKEYVAGVTGAAVRGELRDRLARSDGRTRVVSAGGEAAVSFVRELERRGEHALLSVRIETGRTHQIRAQLAHRGAPVAGDALYGGEVAERLMLHARHLTIPSLGLDVTVELPPAMRRWLAGDARDPLGSPELLAERLARAATRRLALSRSVLGPRPTTAFRLVHEDGDALPGIAVDVYGDHLVLHVSREGLDETPVLDALDALGFRSIYVKRRPARASTLDDADRSERAPDRPVRGEATRDEGSVLEGGIPFLVRLGDGMSTGLFLDQREHRARVREVAAGRRVLNLFAYTCGFSVAAGVGGARQTTSVDASQRALDRGRANLRLSGLPDAEHRLVHGDALDLLASFARRKERFDLVVCDPPTYSTTKSGRFTRKRWPALARACLDVLAPGGILCATSNDRSFGEAALLRIVREACARRRIERLVSLGPPRDFAAAPGSPLHLRGAWLELAG